MDVKVFRGRIRAVDLGQKQFYFLAHYLVNNSTNFFTQNLNEKVVNFKTMLSVLFVSVPVADRCSSKGARQSWTEF